METGEETVAVLASSFQATARGESETKHFQVLWLHVRW
jgi:hypothetical protein